MTVNFNVYLDDDTAKRLAALARTSGVPRNALVRTAVTAWLDRQGRSWPTSVLEYRGDPTLAPFESSRRELAMPSDDPFAPSVAHDRARRKRR